jgi:segregation and condensation protein A
MDESPSAGPAPEWAAAMSPLQGEAPSKEASAGPSEWRVKLPVFEGPLDLLLFLIKKDEVDIYDISIERITKQYQEYLRLMRMLDLEMAGEFLIVAATLLYIKSRTLLPKDQQPPEDDSEEDDPRWELIRQLVEYKKFKDAAWQLQLRHLEFEKAYPRRVAPPELTDAPATPDSPLLLPEVGIFDLIAAFKKVLDRANKPEDLKEIFEDRWTVSDKIVALQEWMAKRDRLQFEELFENASSRTEIVVTFLALLELIRMKKLRVIQPDPFAAIEILRLDGSLDVIPPPIEEPVSQEPRHSLSPGKDEPEDLALASEWSEEDEWGQRAEVEITEPEPNAGESTGDDNEDTP